MNGFKIENPARLRRVFLCRYAYDKTFVFYSDSPFQIYDLVGVVHAIHTENHRVSSSRAMLAVLSIESDGVLPA